jgi:hypothetical protein
MRMKITWRGVQIIFMNAPFAMVVELDAYTLHQPSEEGNLSVADVKRNFRTAIPQENGKNALA